MGDTVQVDRRVSVVVVTCNRRAMLIEALASCVDQTAPAFEIIIVDNGSSDGSEFIQDIYPFVRYIKIARASIGFARNIGINAARGDLITFLDSDDILLDRKIAIQSSLMIHRALEFTYTNYLVQRGNHRYSVPFGKLSAAFWREQFPYGATSFMCSRDSLVRLGGFDESLVVAEDWDLFIRYNKSGYMLRNINDALYVYRLHDGNVSSDPTIDHRGFWNKVREKHGLPLVADAQSTTFDASLLNYLTPIAA